MDNSTIIILCIAGWLLIGFFSGYYGFKLDKDFYSLGWIIWFSLIGLVTLTCLIIYIVEKRNIKFPKIGFDFREKK